MNAVIFNILVVSVFGFTILLFSGSTYIAYNRFGISWISGSIGLMSSLVVLFFILYFPFYIQEKSLDPENYEVIENEYSVDFIVGSDTTTSNDIYVKKHVGDTSKVKLKAVESFNMFGEKITRSVSIQKPRQNNEKK